jgi:hypothetical protein
MSLPLITTIDHSGSYPQQANMSASMCGPTQHQVNLFKFQDWRKRRTVFPNVILAQHFCLLSLFDLGFIRLLYFIWEGVL